MAAGTDFSHSCTNIEGGYGNDSSEVAVVKDEISDNSTLSGKPPRHLSAVRHSETSSPLMSPTELVSTIPAVLSSYSSLLICGIKLF